MSGKDKVYEERVGNKENRDSKAERAEDGRKKEEKAAKKRPVMTVDDIEAEDSNIDEDYTVPEVAKKTKSKTVTIELPRNPWKNPETTQMMDRLKLTPTQSFGFFSTIVKTGTIAGEKVDLNEFTCSTNTIARSRNRNRGLLFQLAREEF